MSDKKIIKVEVECANCGHEWPIDAELAHGRMQVVNKSDLICPKCGKNEIRK